MNKAKLLSENLQSLFAQYRHLITSASDPDVHDIRDLAVGLSVGIDMIRQGEPCTDPEIMEMVMPFLRAAYGVGLSRGGAEIPEKPSPSIWHRIAKLIGV